MAKNILKAWLVDNTVTSDDKTDKIFQLESTRTADLTYIIDRMVAKNPGVLRTTMEMIVKLHNEVVAEEVLNGVSVNTGLFRAVAQFRGTAVNDAWDPKKDSVYVSFTQGKTLRESIQDTTVEVLGDRPAKFYIGSTSDVATKATDYSATAGRNLTLYGKNILPAGDDPSVGITLTNTETQAVTRLTEDMIAVAEPSRLVILIPSDLDDGEYTLTVTTQYKGSSNDFLKTPRSTSQTIYIGGAPQTPDSGDDDDSGQGTFG
ncbi:MAG TPA: DUF4469 domain-containing protein [Candidatus Bacteroides merdipullorum]|uniref:DUF4469 domain-containing protein n=1 Tax=Candidatus Bacteroides merdipullorum TaxID=2838474 RepID=A0A9D2A6D2_9BACE|nr:DUF4469 domain-containing protein [Candidatus Bacteroides merdipullorum]